MPVVRHVHRVILSLPRKVFRSFAGFLAQLGVEVAQRFIEQDDLGLGHQGARERDALLLAAGELGRGALFHAFQVHEAQRLGHALADDLLGDVADLQRVGDVVEHIHVRPDGIGLEHHAEPALLRGTEMSVLREHYLVADADFARVRRSRPTMQRSSVVLPQPLGPSKVKDLVGGDGESDVVEGGDCLAPEK